MTAVLQPLDTRPTPSEPVSSTLQQIREFDLLDTVGTGLAKSAGVEPAVAPAGAPRLDLDLMKRAGGAILRNPRDHPVLIAFAVALAAFSVTVFVLLVTGRIGDFYEAIWSRYPGRPWTHVMRDHPWVYLVLSVPCGAIPYVLAPPERWGRAFLTYVIVLIGFLGGHVFW